jgi:hypothetical protein
MKCALVLACLFAPANLAWGGGQSNLQLQLDRGQTPGFVHISCSGPSAWVYRLLASSNLTTWTELARTREGLIRYPDARSEPTAVKYYRVAAFPATEADDYKNQVVYPDDPLLSPFPPYESPQPRWIKFAIILDDPSRVYFQDSTKYPFHYDFASKRLPGFTGLSAEQFAALSLRTNGQKVVVGALLYAPNAAVGEVGIQFAGLDAFAKESIAAWFKQVKSKVVADPSVQFFYLPTFEQSEIARLHPDYWISQGIQTSSADRWISTDVGYAWGWAIGRLVFLNASQINAAYTDGRLRPNDVLLTDVVPAEIPPVAGIITLTPATPNSHVALLAASFGIPFAYPADPVLRELLPSWQGRDVFLRTEAFFHRSKLTLVPLDEPLAPNLREEIVSLKRPAPLKISPKQRSGQISLSTEGLHPADVRYVGGKAAHFGLLRRSIPAHCPTGLALTFDLWDAFLDQLLPGGTTLRQHIQNRLAGFVFPPDMARLKNELAGIRDLITGDADFSLDQKQAILAVLSGFEPTRKIRFRSSTNVEDSDQFSGAGLYDSFSGCLADDLDNNTQGPCLCDSTEAKERGVFRAIKKVYASFYNDNAYLERLRHGIDESQAGMGVLVHYSTPDAMELANGVATLKINKYDSYRSVDGSLVTQLGAVSVANPDATARPERVSVGLWSDTLPPYLQWLESSGLVQLGAYVLAWPTDYEQLFGFLNQAALAYEKEYPAKSELVLDFEYKKVEPGKLLVKQIREVPRNRATNSGPNYLLNAPNHYVVLQGEHADVFAIHRLKSTWAFQTRNLKLSSSNLTASLYSRFEAQVLEGSAITHLSEAPDRLPDASYTHTAEETIDRWSFGAGVNHRAFALHTSLVPFSLNNQCPVQILSDLSLRLEAKYAAPQPFIDYSGPSTTTRDEVMLVPQVPVTPECLLQHRTLLLGGGKGGSSKTIETSFYWPPAPDYPTAGYTAPVIAWVETRITGFTTSPVILHHPFAQSYHPGHHNFWEDFLFEPGLDPSLDPTAAEELRQANIRGLHATWGEGNQPRWLIWGFDNTLRPVP